MFTSPNPKKTARKKSSNSSNNSSNLKSSRDSNSFELLSLEPDPTEDNSQIQVPLESIPFNLDSLKMDSPNQVPSQVDSSSPTSPSNANGPVVQQVKKS